MGPVEARARRQLGIAAVQAGVHVISVVLDLVQPFRVVPILQERDVYKSRYTPGTYRHKGCGDRLPDMHAAAATRWIETGISRPV